MGTDFLGRSLTERRCVQVEEVGEARASLGVKEVERGVEVGILGEGGGGTLELELDLKEEERAWKEVLRVLKVPGRLGGQRSSSSFVARPPSFDDDADGNPMPRSFAARALGEEGMFSEFRIALFGLGDGGRRGSGVVGKERGEAVEPVLAEEEKGPSYPNEANEREKDGEGRGGEGRAMDGIVYGRRRRKEVSLRGWASRRRSARTHLLLR